MLRNFCKTPSTKSSTVFSRLRSSLQVTNPSSDRVNESQAKQLTQTLKSSISKSRSERKIKNILYGKQNSEQGRSSSVKIFTPTSGMNITNQFKKTKVVLSDGRQNGGNRDKDKERQREKQRERQRQKDNKNDKSRLNDQYKQCLIKLDHSKHIHIGDNQCFLDYKAFISIMTQLNYLNLWKEDNILLNEMWKDLGGEDYGGFLKSSLLLFLEMMQGMIEIESSKTGNEGLARHERVYKKYQRFRSNRANANSKIQTVLSKSSSKIKLKQQYVPSSQQSINKDSFPIKQSIKIRDEQGKANNRNQVKLRKKSDVIKKSDKPVEKHNQKVFRVCFQLDQIIALKEQNLNLPVKQNTTQIQQAQTKPNSSNHQEESSHSESLDEFEQVYEIKPKSIRVPLLSLDINLGQGRTDKIIIYEGDTSKFISEQLAIKHCLDKITCDKFEKILDNHLKHLLSKIEQVEELTEDLSCSHRQI